MYGEVGALQASAGIASSTLLEIRLVAPIFSSSVVSILYDIKSDFEEEDREPILDVKAIQARFGLLVEKQPLSKVSAEDKNVHNHMNATILFHMYDHFLNSGYERFLHTSSPTSFSTYGLSRSSRQSSDSRANVQYREVIALLNCVSINNSYEMFMINVNASIYKVTVEDRSNSSKLLLPERKEVIVLDSFEIKEGDGGTLVERALAKRNSNASLEYLDYIPRTFDQIVSYHTLANGIRLTAPLKVSLLQTIHLYEDLLDGDNNFIDNKSTGRNYYEKMVKPERLIVSYCTEDRRKSLDEKDFIIEAFISQLKNARHMADVKRFAKPTAGPLFQTARSLKVSIKAIAAATEPLSAPEVRDDDFLFADMGWTEPPPPPQPKKEPQPRKKQKK